MHRVFRIQAIRRSNSVNAYTFESQFSRKDRLPLFLTGIFFIVIARHYFLWGGSKNELLGIHEVSRGDVSGLSGISGKRPRLLESNGNQVCKGCDSKGHAGGKNNSLQNLRLLSAVRAQILALFVREPARELTPTPVKTRRILNFRQRHASVQQVSKGMVFHPLAFWSERIFRLLRGGASEYDYILHLENRDSLRMPVRTFICCTEFSILSSNRQL